MSEGNGAYSRRLRLLILQPTAFCNISCRYCYLPNRNETHRLQVDDLETVVHRLVKDDLFGEFVEICWHAGEPLAVGVPYYEAAVRTIRNIIPSGTAICHTIQTNGLLINQDWCRFFADNGVNLGISLDGPEDIHDRYRT